MLAVIALARGPFAAGQRHAWNTIASSVRGWFLIDTTFSAVHGVWGNVALNLATAVLFAVPLLGSHKHFMAVG